MTALDTAPEAAIEDVDHRWRGMGVWLPWIAGAAFALGLAMAGARIFIGKIPGSGKVGATWAMMDFFSSMYYPAQALLTGGNPHDTAWYVRTYPVTDGYGPFLPINLVIHLPFALVGPATASQLYFGFSVLTALALGALAIRLAGLTVRWPLVFVVAGLLLISRQGHWTLLLGQPAFLLACFCYLTLIHLRSAPLLAAFALSLAAFKPTFGVPLALMLLVAGHVRVVAAGAAMGLVVNLPLWWILSSRAGGFVPFFQNMIADYQAWQTKPSLGPAFNYRLIDIAPLISRFLGETVNGTATLLLTVAIPVVAGLVMRRLDWERQAERDVAVAIACTAILFCTHHLGYDGVLLLAPAVALIARGLPVGTHPALRYVFLLLYFVPAMNWATTDAVLGRWQGSHAIWLTLASINGLCLAALFLGYLGVAIAQGDRPPRSTSPRVSAQLV